MAKERNISPREAENAPSLRVQAFLEERLQGLVETGPETTAVRTRGLGAASNAETTESTPLTAADIKKFAALRLQKLQEYRALRRQQKGLRTDPRSGAVMATRDIAAAAPANNWIPLGPSVVIKGQAETQPLVSGRVRDFAISPGSSRVYVATANGGIWRSEDEGKSWRSLMDGFDQNPTAAQSDSLACAAVELIPGATTAQDTIFVGSGEGEGGAFNGVGPVISTDGGQNWNTETSAPTLVGASFMGMSIVPGTSAPVNVIAGTTLGLYRRESDGLGGVVWNQKALPGQATNWVTSVVVARTGGTNTCYAAVWGDSRIYSSPDNGATWNPMVVPGWPAARVGRVELAVQPDNPAIIYAQITLTGPGVPVTDHLLGIYRLDTADNNWRLVANIPNTLFGPNPTGPSASRGQGSYDSAIAVDPTDVNRIYIGGSTTASGGAWSASLYRCSITVNRDLANNITGYSAAATYIGSSVHADVHALVFPPGEGQKLWVGCDGGVFYSTNPRGTGHIFEAKNAGLQTLTMNQLGQHPTEAAVLFCGTQDNGTVRYTGSEVWLHSAGGDGGAVVVNWANPYQVVNIYTNGGVRRTTNGGAQGSYSDSRIGFAGSIAVPLAGGENVLFYPPLVGPPANPGTPAEANILAFGSMRPWISRTFGGPGGAATQGDWVSIPNGTLLGDQLGDRIRSMVFATANILYVGTMNGEVYRYVFSPGPATWAQTRLDNIGGATSLRTLIGNKAVTTILVDPTDATNNSFYLSLAGTGDYRHIWHFDGTANPWQQRSGPAPGDAASVPDVQFNALALDPHNNGHLYAGADIGVWYSADGGLNWVSRSEGLPDAAVFDLQVVPRRMSGPTITRPALIRAATHGRGVFERTLDTGPKPGIQLYVQDTVLDRGEYATVDGLPDPTNQGSNVNFKQSIDIKVDTPDVNGRYQVPLSQVEAPDFAFYVDKLNDQSGQVATHASAVLTSKVYVQVHNRGVSTANGVRVMLLLAPAAGGVPNLPAGYAASVSAGTAINTGGWKTVGMTTVNGIRVGFPKVASFELTSDLLPKPADLPGQAQQCLLALIHHPNDPFLDNELVVDTETQNSRQATQKIITVSSFAGTLPSSLVRQPLAGYVKIPASATVAGAPLDPFLAGAFRINDQAFAQRLSASLTMPLVPNGADPANHTTPWLNPPAQRLVQAQVIEIDAEINLLQGVPLIWMARQRITLKQKINGQGKGAQNSVGDFGGSGGGGTAAGQACQVPISGIPIFPAATPGQPGTSLTEAWASRALLSLSIAKGGAAGGDASGGNGGGVICLCAPVINFEGSGALDVRGLAGGSGNAGGGGGGLIILIAKEINGLNLSGGSQNIFTTGGSGIGTGGAGGNGLILQKIIN